MPARGQLYAGSLQNAQNATTDSNNQAENGLQRSVMAFLARNQQQRGQANVDYEMGSGQASADRISRAPSNPLYDPTTAPPGGTVKPWTAPVAPAVRAPKKRKTVSKIVSRSNHLR
jgi:hypothetical protein